MGGERKREIRGLAACFPSAPLLPRVVCLPTYAALAVIWLSLREGNHVGCVLHGRWREGKGKEGKGREGRRGKGGGVGGFVNGEVREHGMWEG